MLIGVHYVKSLRRSKRLPDDRHRTSDENLHLHTGHRHAQVIQFPEGHHTAKSMHLDPLSGFLFVFKNKHGDRIKVVYWDVTGFAMWYKVLQRGNFKFPDLQNMSSAGLEIDPSTLQLILDGSISEAFDASQDSGLPEQPMILAYQTEHL